MSLVVCIGRPCVAGVIESVNLFCVRAPVWCVNVRCLVDGRKMDYDDEVLAMDSEEAEVLEEAGIGANIGTVEVQGESEIVDACMSCDCSRVVVSLLGVSDCASLRVGVCWRSFVCQLVFLFDD